MTFLQRLFSKFSPEIERESREWKVDCSKCGHRDTVWDRGGIRYKAYGTKRVYGRCRSCGARSMLKVSRSL